MSYKNGLFLSIIMCGSLAAAIKSSKKCDFIACGNFEIVETFQANVRCVNASTIGDPNSAPLVPDRKCTMHLIRTENGKNVHYLVLSSLKHCELKKGDHIEMRIRDGGLNRLEASKGDPCPTGTLSIKRSEDNKLSSKDLESVKIYINVDSFGVCTEQSCLKN